MKSDDHQIVQQKSRAHYNTRWYATNRPQPRNCPLNPTVSLPQLSHNRSHCFGYRYLVGWPPRTFHPDKEKLHTCCCWGNNMSACWHPAPEPPMQLEPLLSTAETSMGHFCMPPRRQVQSWLSPLSPHGSLKGLVIIGVCIWYP